MEAIDRKFKIRALHTTKGKAYTEHESVLFLAKDKALPATLRFYKEECYRMGAKKEQLIGIQLLIARIERYQQENPEIIKVADIDKGPEEDYVNRQNEK